MGAAIVRRRDRVDARLRPGGQGSPASVGGAGRRPSGRSPPVSAAPASPAPLAATTAQFGHSDWAIFSAVSLIWGASFLFIAVGLESLEPGVVTLLRVGLGGLTLALLPGTQMRLQPGDRSRMVALSVVWVGIPFTLFPLAEQHINSAVAGLLNGAVPMFTAGFGVLLFHRRTSGPQLLGLGVGILGVVLISLPSLSASSSQALGVGLVLLATFCYGLATNLAAPLQARYGSRPVMARMLALATVWTLPFGLAGVATSRIEPAPVAAVIVLGIVGTGLAYLLMGSLVSRVGPTRASFVTYLIPGVSLALGVVFRGDHVSSLALIGVALVVGGAFLASRQESG
jgi:drug/metabolite transporter (DMT)-like permease